MSVGYEEFVNNLAAIDIDGVRRQYNEPPQSTPSRDLPISFPRLPIGNEGPLGFCSGSRFNIQCDLVVALKPISQDEQYLNYADALRMLDNVQSALRTNNSSVGNYNLHWELRVEVVPLAGADYWSVVATVRDGAL